MILFFPIFQSSLRIGLVQKAEILFPATFALLCCCVSLQDVVVFLCLFPSSTCALIQTRALSQSRPAATRTHKPLIRPFSRSHTRYVQSDTWPHPFEERRVRGSGVGGAWRWSPNQRAFSLEEMNLAPLRWVQTFIHNESIHTLSDKRGQLVGVGLGGALSCRMGGIAELWWFRFHLCS